MIKLCLFLCLCTYSIEMEWLLVIFFITLLLFNKTVYLLFKVRSFQTSSVQRDIDSAAKFIGAGAATVGVAGSGQYMCTASGVLHSEIKEIGWYVYLFGFVSLLFILLEDVCHKRIMHCRSLTTNCQSIVLHEHFCCKNFKYDSGDQSDCACVNFICKKKM